MEKINISLWYNRKKTSDKQPDYRSSFKDENGEWVNVLAGWFRSTNNGSDYISLAIDTKGLKKYVEFEAKRKEAEPAKPVEKVAEPKVEKPNNAIKADEVINPDDLPF